MHALLLLSQAVPYAMFPSSRHCSSFKGTLLSFFIHLVSYESIFIFPKWSHISAEHRSVTSPNTTHVIFPGGSPESASPGSASRSPRPPSASLSGVLGPPACRPAPRPAPCRLLGRHVVPGEASLGKSPGGAPSRRAASASLRPCLPSCPVLRGRALLLFSPERAPRVPGEGAAA